jgi:hypothetical protein
MYPQDIGLARASTGSTIRSPERAFAGSSGPTHPYGMYAQNTLPEGDVAPVAHAAPIAQVGFPGLAAHEYTRHQNPDGEDADDIIGPDGHTEQLPPYTRYPDAAPKERYASAASESSEALHITLPTSQVVNGPVSPNESIESEDNGHQINLAAAAAAAGLASNRGTRERWSEKSKRRTCCGRMPRWAVILLLILLVVVAATAGGVIGRYLKHAAAKHPDDPSPSSPYVAATTSHFRGSPLIDPPLPRPLPPPSPMQCPMPGRFRALTSVLNWYRAIGVFLYTLPPASRQAVFRTKTNPQHGLARKMPISTWMSTLLPARATYHM